MATHVTSREFLNKYNALDNYLRDIVHGDRSRGMISIYKDTLDDPEEQLKFKSMIDFRNGLEHGVFPSDDPVRVDASLVQFLDKHLRYVRFHKHTVKTKMLAAMEERRKKDEMKSSVKKPEPKYESKPAYKHVEEKPISIDDLSEESKEMLRREIINDIRGDDGELPFKNLVIRDVSGILNIEDSSSFTLNVEYYVDGDTVYIEDCAGSATIGIPPGSYDTLELVDVSGIINVTLHRAKFKNIRRHDISGLVSID